MLKNLNTFKISSENYGKNVLKKKIQISFIYLALFIVYVCQIIAVSCVILKIMLFIHY